MPAILIVEDMFAIRRMLCGALGDRYACHAVGAAEEALALMDQTAVDVVITDVRLPGMDGTEFLKRVSRQYPEVPVIVITAGDPAFGEREFLDLGAFGYLLKPFEVGEVEEMVAKALEGREPERGGG